jgi:PAS domain S-box-containing protein
MPLCLQTKKTIKDVVIGLFRHSSQDFVWLLVNAVPFLKEEGEVDYIICSYTDITSQKKSEFSLTQTTQLYQSLVNTQSSFLVRKDLVGYYTFVNSAFCKHFDVTEPETVGAYFYDSVFPEDQALCHEACMQSMQDPGHVVRIRLRFVHQKGSISWIDWEFMTLTDNTGKPTEIQCVGLDLPI